MDDVCRTVKIEDSAPLDQQSKLSIAPGTPLESLTHCRQARYDPEYQHPRAKVQFQAVGAGRESGSWTVVREHIERERHIARASSLMFRTLVHSKGR